MIFLYFIPPRKKSNMGNYMFFISYKFRLNEPSSGVLTSLHSPATKEVKFLMAAQWAKRRYKRGVYGVCIQSIVVTE
jgi:hypothetical protein